MTQAKHLLSPSGRLILATFLLTCITAQADYWEVRSNVPASRQIWAAAQVDGRLFAFAAGPGGNYTYELIPGSPDTWEARTAKPGPVTSYFDAIVIDDLIYVPGGGLTGSSSTDLFYIYDVATDSWTAGPNLPAAVNNYASAALDGKLYLAGGCCSNRSQLMIYDPAAGWTSPSAGLAQARTSPAGAAGAGRFFAIGGYLWPGSTRVDTTEAYNPLTGSWQSRAPIPTAREGHAAVACDGNIFALGGTIHNQLLTSVEVLDTNTDTWSSSLDMPYAPGHTSAVLFEGNIWVFPLSDLPVQVLHTDLCSPEAPTADAGTDLIVNEGELVELDGSGSTAAAGRALTYLWTQVAGPSVTLADATVPLPTFTSPSVPNGGAVLTFTLVVDDGLTSSTADNVNIQVKNINNAPVADAGGDQTVSEGATVQLDASASYDPDGEALSRVWVQTTGTPVTLTNASSETPEFTAPNVGAAGGLLRFELTVSDGIDDSSDSVEIFVENVNHPPVAEAGPDQTVDEGALVSLDGNSSSDPDLDPLTSYSWVQVSGPILSLSDPTSPAPTFTAPFVAPGGVTIAFDLSVSDGDLTSQPSRVIINVQNINDPPNCALARPARGPRSARSPLSQLWPPNHKMIEVGFIGLTDPDNDDVIIEVTGVTSDELVAGTNAGDSSPDASILDGSVLLRAERNQPGNGRVYEVSFTAHDTIGEACSGTVSVCVPPKKRQACIDDGQLHGAL